MSVIILVKAALVLISEQLQTDNMALPERSQRVIPTDLLSASVGICLPEVSLRHLLLLRPPCLLSVLRRSLVPSALNLLKMPPARREVTTLSSVTESVRYGSIGNVPAFQRPVFPLSLLLMFPSLPTMYYFSAVCWIGQFKEVSWIAFPRSLWAEISGLFRLWQSYCYYRGSSTLSFSLTSFCYFTYYIPPSL